MNWKATRARCSRLAVALAAFLAASSGQLRAQQAAEAAIVQLQIGRLAARTVPAYRIDGAALIPLGQFLDLAEVRIVRSGPGFLSARLPQGTDIEVDAALLRASAGSRVVALDSSVLIVEGAELYLATGVLARLLDLEFTADWSNLEVTLRNPDGLPLADRLRREAAQAALLRGGSTLTPDVFIPPDRSRVGGFVLDYSFFSPSDDPLEGSSYTLGAGLDLLGGSLEMGVRSDGPASSGDVRLDASWLGVWRQNTYLRQLRLGDGLGTGPRSRTIRGASVTNAPYVRPSLQADVVYAGRLPSGWEVEAWRNGMLLGIDSTSADGGFGISLPVVYGENPVDFVAYGPFGERREFSRKYLVPLALLPARQFEYGLAAGECRIDPCEATLNADLRYGVSERWTLGVGIDRFWRDSLADRTHPYLDAVGIVGNAWTAEAGVVAEGFVRGRIGYEPTLDLRLSAEAIRFSRAPDNQLLNPLAREEQYQLAAFWRPDRRRGFLFVEGRLEHATTSAGSSWRARAGLSAQLGRVRAAPYARIERLQEAGGGITQGFGGLELFATPGSGLGGALRHLWLRAAYEGRNLVKPELASLTIARPIGAGFRAEAGAMWLRGSSRPTWTFSLATSLPSVRALTLVTAPSAGPATATQYVQGSVLYDRARGGLAFTAGPSLQRGGIAGRVFLDENGNGVHDEGEPGLPNVRVQVGVAASYSDSLGWYRVLDVVPFENVLVRADSLSFDSPLWVAEFDLASAVPAPNRLTIVDVPLLMGTVLEGSVSFDDGTPAAGVSLEVSSGKRNLRATTFSDGTFYLMGVTPGSWTIRVARRSANALEADAVPVSIEVPQGGGALPMVQLNLVPR